MAKYLRPLSCERGCWVCVGRRCVADEMISAGRRQHHDRSTRARCCCWFGQRRCKRCCRRGASCFLELYFWVISCFCFVCCCECWDVCVCLVGLPLSRLVAWFAIGEVYAADYPLWLGCAVAGSGEARCGSHVMFAVPFVCCSKQWGGLLLGSECLWPSNCGRCVARGLGLRGEAMCD